MRHECGSVASAAVVHSKFTSPTHRDGSSCAESARLAIQTTNLRKVYGDLVAVDDLTISVFQGEVFGFLGPNGAGKSTVVKMLTGLARPTSGEAMLLNRNLGDRSAKREIGYLPELFRFHDWLTGREFLDLHGRLSRLSRAEREERIPRSLELVGLADNADQRLRTYSKGMQQRIGLAQALLHNPKLVFLDEPTSALDPLGRRDVRDVIRTLKSRGITVFLNSHLLSEVELVCDRVGILNHGSLVALGPLSALVSANLSVDMRIGEWRDELERAVRAIGRLERLNVDDRAIADLSVNVESETAVASLVDDIVALGGRVYAVAPSSNALEDYFLELIQDDRKPSG